MSVSDVMDTMMSQDATASMGADMTSTGTQTSGESSTAKVSSINDIFNLYDGAEDAEDNGVSFEKDKTTIPDELNNVTPKDIKNESKKEDEPDDTNKSDEKNITPEVKEEVKSIPDMVKVKVNGADIEVPLQDVINSYSGQQEIQRRFTEFDKTKKAFESEKNELVGMNDYVKQEIGGLKSEFQTLLNQYEKNGYMENNPLQAVNNLLDKMGINSNLFERAVFEHQLPDYAKYFNMTDVERDAFYVKKENEFLRRKEQGFNDRDQQVKLREEGQRKDFELIRNAGLDSGKFEELQNELVNAGHKGLTTEKIVEYAQQKPTLDKVVEVFNQLGVNPMEDSRARQVFKLFQEFPDLSTDEVLNHMDANRAALKVAQTIAPKVQKMGKVIPTKEESKELDEMLSFYKN
jgi:arsenate reductase-like glutaredoxin family protein